MLAQSLSLRLVFRAVHAFENGSMFNQFSFKTNLQSNRSHLTLEILQE